MQNQDKNAQMGRIAAIFYGIYALYQALFYSYYLWGQSLLLGSAPPPLVMLEMVLALAAAGLGVWLWAKGGRAPAALGRALVAATALVVVFELLMYNAHALLMEQQAAGFDFVHQYLESDFYQKLLGWTGEPIWILLVQLLRLVLLILAAFFVLSSQALPQGSPGEEEPAEENEAKAEQQAEPEPQPGEKEAPSPEKKEKNKAAEREAERADGEKGVAEEDLPPEKKAKK